MRISWAFHPMRYFVFFSFRAVIPIPISRLCASANIEFVSPDAPISHPISSFQPNYKTTVPAKPKRIRRRFLYATPLHVI